MTGPFSFQWSFQPSGATLWSFVSGSMKKCSPSEKKEASDQCGDLIMPGLIRGHITPWVTGVVTFLSLFSYKTLNTCCGPNQGLGGHDLKQIGNFTL